MTDLLSILCEAAGDFDELEDPRKAKKPKLGVSAKVGAQTRPASLSRHHSVSRTGQGHVVNTSPRQGVSDPKTRNSVSGPVSVPASAQSSKSRAMGAQLYSSSAYTRTPPPTSLIFGFEDRDGGNGPSSPSGSLDSSSVTSVLDEGANGMEEIGSSSEDDEANYGLNGQIAQEGSGSLGGSGGNALLNSKKRKRVTKQSSRRAKPLTVEILYQIFEKLGIQKENVNGTYKLVLPTLKSAECSSVYFAVTEWQCFRKRIMNHGFEIVHEQQSSWIRVRPNLASPDGRLIFEDIELRRRYGTPCKIKNARERNEIFELPVLELELSSFDEEQPLRSPAPSDPEDRLSQERLDSSRNLDAPQSFGANFGLTQPNFGTETAQSLANFGENLAHKTAQSLANFGENLAHNFPSPCKLSGPRFGQLPSSPRDDSFHTSSYDTYESTVDEHADSSNQDFNRPIQTIGLNFGSKRNRRRGGRRMSDGATTTAIGGAPSVQSAVVSSSSSICDDDEDNMMIGTAFDEEGEVDEDVRSTNSLSWHSTDEEGSRLDQHLQYRRASIEMKEERGAASSMGRNGFGFGSPFSVASSPFSVTSSTVSSSSGISVPLASSWAGSYGVTGAQSRVPATLSSSDTFISSISSSSSGNSVSSINSISTGGLTGTLSQSTLSPSTLSISAPNTTSAPSIGNLPPTSLGSPPLGSSPLIASFFSSINLSGTPHFNLPSFSSVMSSTSPAASSLSESEPNATEDSKQNLKEISKETSSFSDVPASMDIDHPSHRIDHHSPSIGEPTHQLEGALRHCFRLPLVARELLSNGHFSLSNGQFDIQVTMKHSPRSHSPAKSSNICFGPSPSSPHCTPPMPRFPPFSAVSGNSPLTQ